MHSGDGEGWWASLARRLPTSSHVAIGILVTAEAIAIILAVANGAETERVADFGTILISLTTVFALVIFHREVLDTQAASHRELMVEQTELRRLQTRPLVLVTFARNAEHPDGDKIVLVIEHFGGGPALDVRFTFDPPLVDNEGHSPQGEPPLSTGIAVMAPSYRQEIPFTDYWKFQEDAGFERLFLDRNDGSGAAIPLSYDATVSLRDPVGDDRVYETRYRLALSLT